jgi:hypothetical protein
MSAILKTSTSNALRRPRPSFTSWELDQLRFEAKAHRISASKYVRAALLFAWGQGPALSVALTIQPPEPEDPPRREKLVRGPKLSLTDAEHARLAEEAKACGMTQAKYMRQAVTAMWHHTPKPKRKPGREQRDLVHQLSHLSFQLKKFGTNVNQLAHQANAGMVPISRPEVEYVLNHHQILLSRIIAAVEKLAA